MLTNQRNRMLAFSFVTMLAATAFAGCLQGGDTGGDDLTLKLGLMTPKTGALANLGPDMENAMKLAVKEVNAAGVGLTIETFSEDDATTDTAGAPAKFQRLISKGVTAVAGPCCSGVTGAILDLAVQNKVVVSTPSATSPTLTDRDNKGYFWRVPPSDAVQGKVLAKLVAGDGHKAVSVILVNNAYGNGLTKVFEEALRLRAGVVLSQSKYEEGATTFSSQVDEACAAAEIKAIVLVAYTDDAANILREMQNKGCLAKVKVYGSEGIYSSEGALATKAGKDANDKFLAAGVKGTTPESSDTTTWAAKFKTEYGHDPELYAAESYDAVMYVALAAIKAKSTDGEDIAAALREIANPPGDKMNAFKAAAEALQGGKDIDWVGVSHDFEFDAKNEPVTGIYSYWQIKDDGTVEIYQRGVTA